MAKKAKKAASDLSHSASTEPQCYSYLRFSTPEQALGKSEQRQNKWAEAIAKKLKLPFSQGFADMGVSGRSGKHVRKGALSKFIAMIKAGAVAPGSVPLVENIDRLSRQEPTDAYDTIVTKIITPGIRVMTEWAEYNLNSLNSRPDSNPHRDPTLPRLGRMQELMDEIDRAHRESQRKSEMSLDNWEGKRNAVRTKDHRLTKMIPFWLSLKLRDGTIISDRQSQAWQLAKNYDFHPIPEAKKVINQIFKLYSKGYDILAITKKLNAERTWIPPEMPRRRSTAWTDSYVRAILRDRKVIGEFQPGKRNGDKSVPDGGDVLPNYYPVIVQPPLFGSVQQRVAKCKRTGGKTRTVTNLFRGLVYCGQCGGPMYPQTTGKKSHSYLACQNSKNGVTVDGSNELLCTRTRIRYSELESEVLSNSVDLRPEVVLPSNEEHVQQLVALRTQIKLSEGLNTELEGRVDTLTERISDPKLLPEAANLLVDQLNALVTKRKKNDDELRRLRQEEKNASANSQTLQIWQDAVSELSKRLDDYDVRVQLREHLSSFIERIEIFPRGRYSLNTCYGPHFKLENLAKRAYDEAMKREPDKSHEHLEWLAGAKGKQGYINPGEREAMQQLERYAVMPKRTKEFAGFLKDFTARRMTREGRFFRIWFKTLRYIDLAPPDSIADCQKLLPPDPKTGKRRWGTDTLELDKEYGKYRGKKKKEKV